MSADYQVGYGRPPQHTRFRTGRSGNPKGRPKSTRNLKTDLLEELNEQIRVREGNKEIKVTKQRAMVKTIVARALKGDQRAANTLATLLARFVDPIVEDAPEAPLSAEEQSLLANLEKRLARRAAESTDEPKDASTSDSEEAS